MYDITAYLTIKNKTFYTVLTYYVDGIRKMKWVSTGFKENESKKKAEKKLIQIRDEFKNKLETITTTKTEDKKVQISFSDFMIKLKNLHIQVIKDKLKAEQKNILLKIQ